MPWFDHLPKDEYRRIFEVPKFQKATEPEPSWLQKAFDVFRRGVEVAQPEPAPDVRPAVERFREVEREMQPTVAEFERVAPPASALQRIRGVEQELQPMMPTRRRADFAEFERVFPDIREMTEDLRTRAQTELSLERLAATAAPAPVKDPRDIDWEERMAKQRAEWEGWQEPGEEPKLAMRPGYTEGPPSPTQEEMAAQAEKVSQELESRLADTRQSIQNKVATGLISQDSAETEWDHATDQALEEMFPLGKPKSRLGFDLSDIKIGQFMGRTRTMEDLFEFEKALGYKMITPLFPEEVYEPLEDIPVIGEKAAEIARGITTPVGLAVALPLWKLTALMVAGELIGWGVGKGIEAGLERVGLPTTREVGPLTVGPAGVLQTIFAFVAPAIAPAVARGAVRGVRAAPAVARTARAEVERLIPTTRRIVAEELGGPKMRPKYILTNDIHSLAEINKRLGQLSRIEKMTAKQVKERSRLLAEKDLHDLRATGTVDDQMDNLLDDILEMEKELELRAVAREVTPARAPQFGTPERVEWEAARAGRPHGARPSTRYSGEPVDFLRERLKVYKEFRDEMKIVPAGEEAVEEALVTRAKFTEEGRVVEEPTFATEGELAGVRPTQAELGISAGQRPIEGLPMFKPTAAEAAGVRVPQKIPTSRAELLAENRRLKTLVQEGRATAEETARLEVVRGRLQSIPEAAPVPKPAAQAFREATEIRPTALEEAPAWELAGMGTREDIERAAMRGIIRRPPPEKPPVSPSIVDQPPSMDLWRILEREHITGPNAQNALRWLAETASKGGKPIAGLIRVAASPAALARIDPVRRAGVVYRLMEEIQTAQRGIRMAGFRGRYPFKNVGKSGQVEIAGKRVAFADVAENPSRYALTAEQRQWIEEGWRWIDEWAGNYERIVGKPIRAKAVEREHYWPRFAADERGRIYIRTRIGVKESPAKHRVFGTMEEGITEGVPYAAPADSLELYIHSMQKMTRDELLKNVIRVDKIGRAVTPALRQRIEDARKAVRQAKTPEAKASAQEKLEQLRAAREAIVTPRRGEVIGIQIGPGMAGTVFERETAAALKGILGPGQRALYPAAQIAAVPRMLITGMLDVGHFCIQGLSLLAYSPLRWAAAIGRSIQAMAAPKSWLKSVAARPAAQRAGKYGVDIGGSEFTEAARAGGLLGWFPPARVVGRSFDTFLAEGRIQMFDGMAEVMIREEGVTALHRLGRFVNTMLGAPAMRGVGVSTTQNQIERAFIFFSPRYTRSIFGTTAYIFGKGYTANQARLILGKMVFGGLAMFYGLARAWGLSHEEAVERINPQSRGRFMSLPIGGQEVGMGSAYRATLGFLGSLTVKDNWEFDSWGEFMLKNPLVRYLRARAAPGTTSTLIDFIAGEDFLGYPVSIDEFISSPRRALEYLSDKLLPLNIEAILEAEGTKEKIVAGVVETFGGRAYPRSPYVRLEELWKQKRLEVPSELGEPPAKLEDADRSQRLWFYALPDVAETRAAQVEQAAARRQTWGEFGQQRLEAEKEFETRMVAFTGTGQEFRAQYRDFRREWASRANQQYGEDFERDPRSDVERAADEWWAVELTYKADGSRDWDAFFDQRKAIEDANSGLDRWLKGGDILRWPDDRMKDRVRQLLEADAIADEYYSIPYKDWLPAEFQDAVREYVEHAQSIASLQGIPFEEALMQTRIDPGLIDLALEYKKAPINPFRAMYWEQYPGKKALFYKFYRDIPLGIEQPAMAMAGVP